MTVLSGPNAGNEQLWRSTTSEGKAILNTGGNGTEVRFGTYEAPGTNRHAVSHSMEAMVDPADEDFWIGAALEIEPDTYPDMESRCSDMDSITGATCHCSETFAADEGPHSGTFNPSSSTTRQCAGPQGNGEIDSASGGFPITDSVTGQSVGLDGAAYVLHIEQLGLNVDHSSVNSTDSTTCGRYYYRIGTTSAEWGDIVYSAPSSSTDPTELAWDADFKGPRYQDPSGSASMGYQSNMTSGNSFTNPARLVMVTGSRGSQWKCSPTGQGGVCDTGNALKTEGYPINIDTYSTGWVRVEFCADHNPADGLQPDMVYYRGYEEVVTGPLKGARREFGDASVGEEAYSMTSSVIDTGPLLMSGDTTRIFSQGTPKGNGIGGGQAVGSSYLSHVMLASVTPADRTWWIGASSELEGTVTIPPTDPDGEDRCDELGSECLGSEEFNTDTQGYLPIGTWDPPDSTDNELNQQASGNAVNVDSVSSVSTVTIASTPSPSTLGNLSTSDMVLKVDSQSAQVVGSASTDFTNSTWCSRTYFRDGASLALPPSGPTAESIALGLYNTPSQADTYSPGVSVNYDSNGFRCIWIDPNIGWTSSALLMPSSGNEISSTECGDDGWCRLEVCFDHNMQGSTVFGNDPDDDTLQVRCKITALDTGKQRTWVDQSTNQQPVANTGTDTLIRRNLENVTNTPSAYPRYTSYTMTAKRSPADDTFWINQAYEIEGTGTITPPAAPSGTVTVTAAVATSGPASVIITLDGSGVTCPQCTAYPNGYEWSKTAGTGTCSGGIDDKDAQSTFASGCGVGTYTYQLVASNGVNPDLTVTDSDTVAAYSAPSAPTASVTVTAQAPGHQPGTITLDGSATTCNLCTSYAWTYTSGPGCNITDFDAESTECTASAEGTHEFKLTVINGGGTDNASDTAIITAPPDSLGWTDPFDRAANTDIDVLSYPGYEWLTPDPDCLISIDGSEQLDFTAVTSQCGSGAWMAVGQVSAGTDDMCVMYQIISHSYEAGRGTRRVLRAKSGESPIPWGTVYQDRCSTPDCQASRWETLDGLTFLGSLTTEAQCQIGGVPDGGYIGSCVVGTGDGTTVLETYARESLQDTDCVGSVCDPEVPSTWGTPTCDLLLDAGGDTTLLVDTGQYGGVGVNTSGAITAGKYIKVDNLSVTGYTTTSTTPPTPPAVTLINVHGVRMSGASIR
jgi:hypothetical protein